MTEFLRHIDHLWIAIALYTALFIAWLFYPSNTLEQMMLTAFGVVIGALTAGLRNDK